MQCDELRMLYHRKHYLFVWIVCHNKLEISWNTSNMSLHYRTSANLLNVPSSLRIVPQVPGKWEINQGLVLCVFLGAIKRSPFCPSAWCHRVVMSLAVPWRLVWRHWLCLDRGLELDKGAAFKHESFVLHSPQCASHLCIANRPHGLYKDYAAAPVCYLWFSHN